MQTLTSEQQAALDKIQALLNVTTERGATEAEAIQAGKLAAKLLLKWNLTLDDVNLAYEAEKVSLEVNEESVKYEAEIKNTFYAQVHLASTCAKISGCKSLFNKNDKIFYFYGVESDRRTAISLFRYYRKIFLVILEIEKKKALSDQRRLYGNSKLGRGWDLKFYQGICDRVSKALETEFADVIKQEKAEQYMLVKVNQITEYIADKYPTIRAVDTSNMGINNENAYNRGWKAGGKVGLPKEQPKITSGARLLK